MTELTHCIHSVSFEVDCKECEKENKIYAKECLDRGKPLTREQ